MNKEDETRRHLLPIRATDEQWREILTWCNGCATGRGEAILSMLGAPETVSISKVGHLTLNSKVLARLGIDLKTLSVYTYRLKYDSSSNVLKVILAPEIGGHKSFGKTLFATVKKSSALGIDLRGFFVSRKIDLAARVTGIPVKYDGLSIEIPVPG